MCSVHHVTDIVLQIVLQKWFFISWRKVFLENGLLIERIPKELITTPEDLGDQEVEIL